MKVQIFTAQLLNQPGNHLSDPFKQREEAASALQNKVNNFLEKYPAATIQWLQHSAANRWGSFTQLTAVVSYNS